MHGSKVTDISLRLPAVFQTIGTAAVEDLGLPTVDSMHRAHGD